MTREDGALVRAFAGATVGLAELGLDGVVRAANPALTRMTGVDVVGSRLEQLVAPGDRAGLLAATSALLDGRSEGTELALLLRAGGGVLPTTAALSLERDSGGAPVGMLLVLHDDQAHDARVQVLDDAGRRARTLLQALPDGILVCSVDGTIREVNHQVEALFGYSADELVGQAIEVLVPRGSAREHRRHRERYSGGAHAHPMSTGPGVNGLTKDGAEVPVEVTLAQVDLADGPAVVASVRDVTQARRTAEQLRAAHDLTAGILGAATEQAILAIDLDGDVDVFSAGAERLLGWSAAEVLHTSAARFDDPTQEVGTTWGGRPGQPLADRVRELVASGVSVTHPSVYVTRSGERRAVLLSMTVRHGPHGPAGLIVVATDQTAQLRQEAELRASEERFRRAFEHAPVGFALLSAEPDRLGTFLRVNGALGDMLGFSEGELLGTSVLSLAHPETLPAMRESLEALVQGGSNDDRHERRCVHADGSDVWVQVSLSLVRDEDDRPAYVIAQLADVTERRRAEAELTHNALHDPLTGLPNRPLLSEHLAQALTRARQRATTVAVLYVDVDNFKDVNDSLGHAAGDELLVDIAHRLEDAMREGDTVGRFGGDEFVVICEDVATLDEVRDVADRITSTLAVQLPVAGRMVSVSASIGIAHSTGGLDRPEDLVRIADIAMYRAKANGRAQYEFSDPELQARAIRQLELEADLRRALDVQSAPGAMTASREDLPAVAGARPGRPGELCLEYQPCFDAATGRVVAVEALIRWDHPVRGRLPPGEFLDVAEDRALMVPLGLWVLRAACEQAAEWVRRYGDAAPEMWVNVSSRQLGRHRFAAQVEHVLTETGLAPSSLWIELTERQALSTAASALADLHALPTLGVRLAIDDFGTGYAGLDYLRRLPVSSLKVDASYVAAIGTEPSGTALAAGVVNIGRALGLTVVAEGVETPEQRQVMVDLGAHVLQGYLLARPGPPEQVDELLASTVACQEPS